MKKLLVIAATISLMGAGCFSSPTPAPAPIKQPPIAQPPVTSPPPPESSEQNMPPQENPPPATKPAPTTSTYNVIIQNFSYAPTSITVKKGDKISVTNRDEMAHTLTADDGTSFDTGLIFTGKSMVIDTKNIKPGTYTYHCAPHPFIKGTLIVE